MELDKRLKKIATGVSARELAHSHPHSVAPGRGTPADDEKARIAEFKATIEAMFLMAAVDGEVSDVEFEQLGASIHAIADTKAIESIRVNDTLRELADKLARDGWRARLEAVGQRIRTDEAKQFAFRLAASVAFVDDHVAHAEAAAIDALAAALGLGSEESQSILRDVQEELFGGD